jgi:uncharacterized coiled-coil protein SlyX
MSEDRLIALEEKAAYFEKLAGELDQVVRDLNTDVSALRRELERLKARIEAPPPEALDPNERPPHY